MKTCPNCHNQSTDDTLSCPVCGTTLDSLASPSADYFKANAPVVMPELIPLKDKSDSRNRTESFSSVEIQESRIACMCAYILGIPGVIISLLMCSYTGFARFHIDQAIKITIAETLTVLICLILCWTILIPVLGALLMAVFLVIRLCCFNDVRNGKARDAILLRKISL